ncbi:MAG: ABC transporter permease [Dactylosporangium sp.]|nr:ABC transporter permease [Dactylosporangium sp.]NNJ60403.1 ABC transporter permease [Dactylosporangium sp.]
MFRYIVRRLLQMALAFFGTTLLVYAMMFAAQGDPIQALAGEKPVSASQRAVLTERYHLDKTGIDGFLYRYWDYVSNLMRGDFGTTLAGRSISDVLQAAWPFTIKLALMAISFVIVFGITAGVIAGIRRGSLFDTTTLLLTLVVIGIPVFVLGYIGQYLLTNKWRLFKPTANDGSLYSLLLPALVLGMLALATALRLTRTSVAENLRSDYVRTAKSKGLPQRRVIGVHVLRNSLIPVVTYLGITIGDLMSGAIVTERIFNVPGIGFNVAKGIQTEDGPLVVGIISLLVIVYLTSNLIVDVLYAVLDPRIRYE